MCSYRIGARLFQGALTFELTGLYPALSFFTIESGSGVIRVVSSLRADPLQLPAYTVRAVVALCLALRFLTSRISE